MSDVKTCDGRGSCPKFVLEQIAQAFRRGWAARDRNELEGDPTVEAELLEYIGPEHAKTLGLGEPEQAVSA